MALLFCDSYDHYETVDLPRKYSTIQESPVVAANGRCGTNGLVLTPYDVTIKGVRNVSRTECIFGLAIKFVDIGSGLNNFASVMGGSAVVMEFRRSSTGAIEYSINSQAAFAGYTTLTEADVLRIGIWYYLEFKVVLATSASGSIEVHVNSEDVTLPGFSSGVTTAFYANYWDGVRVYSGGFGGTIYTDDFYISDTSGAAPWNDFLGDVRVEYLQPTSDGATQDWTNFGGAAAWNSVDDGSAPDDDTTYITTSTQDDISTFEYEDAALPSGANVFGVQMSFLALKEEPGDRAIRVIVREGSTDYEHDDNIYISDESYDYRHVMMQVNPADDAAWEIDDVNDNEFGVKVEV